MVVIWMLARFHGGDWVFGIGLRWRSGYGSWWRLGLRLGFWGWVTVEIKLWVTTWLESRCGSAVGFVG